MTDRPTNAPRGLEDVLAEHDDATGWTVNDDDAPTYECICGDQSPALTHDYIYPEDVVAAAAWHRAHVAAAIREWLTSEAVVEAAARAHWTAWSFNDADSHDITNAQEHNEHMTRAALAAAAGAALHTGSHAGGDDHA